MIESQLRRRILSPAVLASRVVAQKNVLPGERATLKRNVDIFGKPNNRRRMNGEFLRVKYVSIVLFDPGYALKDHDHRAPFGAHVYRFEGGV